MKIAPNLIARFSLLLLVGLLFVSNGCKHAPIRPSKSVPDTSSTGCINVPSVPTYTADVAPILAANCTSCHYDGAPNAEALNTYLDAKAVAGYDNGDYLLNAIKHENTDASNFMPQGGGKLGACQILTIERWILTGKLQ